LSGTCIADKRRISFLNVYGPCTDRKIFWEKVDGRGLLAHSDLIVAGDLNFTTSAKEVWGVSALLDPLAVFFKEIFLKNQLVDIPPAEVVPTWRNGRIGVEEISKRLDRVYVSEDLISSSVRYRSWVDYPFISDHALVLLQLGLSSSTVAHPFKLNPTWLREDTFSTLVQEVWNDHQFLQEEGAQRRLVGKLKQLKMRVKSWSKEKRI
jgi:hypothetical protein